MMIVVPERLGPATQEMEPEETASTAKFQPVEPVTCSAVQIVVQIKLVFWVPFMMSLWIPFLDSSISLF